VVRHPRQPPLLPELLLQVLTETMEEMKLVYPNPQLDVGAIKKSLKAAA